jgi:hypothetical protein
MEILYKRKTSNCPNDLAASYGTMYQKIAIARNMVATSCLIMALKAALSGKYNIFDLLVVTQQVRELC